MPAVFWQLHRKAMNLAVQYVDHDEVKSALLSLLEGRFVPTSLELQAARELEDNAEEPHAREILTAALGPENSNDVQLRAVNALTSQAGIKGVRQALVDMLRQERSVPVVLASMGSLRSYVTKKR
jgi:hypothetical protein